MTEGGTSRQAAADAAPQDDHATLIEAYISILCETRRVPEVGEVGRRAGLSFRALYRCWPSFEALGIAAFDELLTRRMPRPPTDPVMGDRQMRIRAQVLVRAAVCEAWLPLWRVVLQQEARWPPLAERVEMLRAERRQRLLDYYAPELDGAGEVARRAVLTALEAVTDFTTWGDMRERQKLSREACEQIWIDTTERLMPPTPQEAATPTASLLYRWRRT